MFKKIKNKVCSTTTSVKAVIADKMAEGYVDSGVKILIAVVIGALLLAGLYTLFNTNILPTLTTKITSLFNYAGK
ncbi:MAG TPA: hypothetical protein DD733_08780 [Clostridiales bacterium]|nr:hypothetical protein [Clostridiales bacterium]